MSERDIIPKQARGLLEARGVFLNHLSARVAAETGFEVRDIESLWEHYALMLRR